MKKILLIITAFLLFIPLSVHAADNNYEIKSIELFEKSENTEILSEATTDGSNIKFDIQFLNVDDYATYKVVVKNNSDKDLKFNEKSIVLDNPYIGYDFNYENNSKVIKAGNELIINIKVSYKEYVPSNLFRSNIYDGSRELLLNLNDGFISIPNALKNIGIFGFLLIKTIILLIIIGIVMVIKNKNVSNLQLISILLLLILCPCMAKAVNGYDIPIDSGVKVLGTKPTICNTTSELVQGLEYRISSDSQYIYKYKQAWTGSSWNNIDTDGWGVKLADPDSTDDVTETLCSVINDKPIVNMDYMFNNTKAKHIDLSSFVTNKVESMIGMFNNATELEEIDFRTFNTESVKTMHIMLQNCNKLKTLTLRQFVTENVVGYSAMFAGDSSLEYLNLDGWDVSKAGVAGGHLGGTTSLKEISLKDWKLSEYFTHWISRSWGGSSSPIEKIDVTGWDLSGTKSIEGLFADSKSLKTIVGLDTWDTSNLNIISSTFYGCSSIKGVDLSAWDTSSVTSMDSLFYLCTSLEEMDLSSFNTSNVTSYYSMFTGCTNLKKLNIDNWDVRKAGVGGGQLSNTTSLKEVSAKNWKIPSSFENWIFRAWGGNTSPIEKLDVTGWDLSITYSLNGLLGTSPTVKEIVGIKDWDTSHLTNVSNLFNSNTGLEEIDLSGWDISNITALEGIFAYTSNLKKINLSNWDYAKLDNTRIHTLLYSYDQNSAVKELILDGSKFHTSLNYAFTYNLRQLEKISFKNVDLSDVTLMEYTFYDNPKLKEIDFEGTNTSTITSMYGLFSTDRSLETVDISGFDTSKVTHFDVMFYNDYSLKEIDLSTLDFSSNPSVNGILQGCPSLETIILDNWDITKLSNYYSIVSNIPKAKLLSLKNWILPEDFNHYEIYNGFGASPRNVVTIDVTGWDLSRIKKLYDFFGNMHGTQNIIGLNTWDTSGIENMNSLFAYDYALEKLDFSSWDLSSITDNEFMISQVSSLRELITPKNIPDGVTIRLPKRMVDSNGNAYEILTSSTPKKTKLVEDSTLSKLLPGKQFNKKIRQIAGVNDDINVEESTIVSIDYRGYNSSIDTSLFTEANKLTVSGDPLYGIYDSTKATVFIYSTKRSEAWDFTFIFNEDCSYMFANFTMLKFLYMPIPDTGKVTNMSYMFYKTAKDTTTKPSFYVFGYNTTYVTNMERMFSHTCENNTKCSIYNIKPSHWNVRNVTNMQGMYEYSAPIANDPSNGNTLFFLNAPKVTDMSSMYEGALRSGDYTIFEFFGLIDTTSLKTTKNMFKNALSNVNNYYDNLLIDRFDTSGIKDMSGMFEEVNIRSGNVVDLGTLNITGNTKIDNMFKNFNNYKLTVNIKKKPTSYTDAFKDASTNGSITVNYTSAVNNIDSIIATKSDGSNVVKGQLIKDN